MKALTLYQPWATWLIRGLKTIETRSWGTSYMGCIAIHAGKTFDRDYLDWLSQKPELRHFRLKELDYPTGAILGKAHLVECVRVTDETRPGKIENLFGDFRLGRFMWIFDVWVCFKEPVPVKGRQGLWEFQYP